MSFFSSMSWVRQSAPPAVTGASLRRLVNAVSASGVVVAGGLPFSCGLRFGPKIDVDVDMQDESVQGMFTSIGAPRYDWEHSTNHLSELAVRLDEVTPSVCRAYLSLGRLSPTVSAELKFPERPENNLVFTPDSLSFEVGPIITCGLRAQPQQAGWMALHVSGNGYFHPWSYRDARLRFEGQPTLGRLAQTCRSIWPCIPSSAPADLVAARRSMRELWLYDRWDLPPDWHWFVQETG